ncbi:MATE efflux family protein DTX1 [Apostasia shenzhenica]|uniref:Protein DETOXIFICATION n=1 Tax=Apostasia shenzhenica TaxID=1088818 RepID=A0A2I0AAD0_9ASPA|nr:MATE efflux family protein DTX1 [Apostasia shenzhenica]
MKFIKLQGQLELGRSVTTIATLFEHKTPLTHVNYAPYFSFRLLIFKLMSKQTLTHHLIKSRRNSDHVTAHQTMPTSPSTLRAEFLKLAVLRELRQQGRIATPLSLMNLTWFAKTTVTTAFLGRAGDLQLAGGSLALTFANVTGFSVLAGLCAAVEPICGRAHGAGNCCLLRRTLMMAVLLLLSASLPIAFVWLNVDRILLFCGQQKEIVFLAKKYVLCLLPHLAVTSFLSPLKAYLSSQGVTLPALFSSAMALALHLPLSLVLSRAKGLEGIAMAVWISDLSAAVMLALYVCITETRKKGDQSQGIWWWGCCWKQSPPEWARLLRLAAPCCLTSCLEWWCYEILILLTGRLPDAKRTLAVITVVLNFDYLLFSFMSALASSASVRISNELGAGRGPAAQSSAYVSLATGVAGGVLSSAATAAARRWWGRVFSRDGGTVAGVRKAMLVMAAVEVVNFPVTVSGGIVRGMARPWLGTYASAGGFYLVGLPLAAVLGFKAKLGLAGMLLGFLIGGVVSEVLMLVFLGFVHWEREAGKAQRFAGVTAEEGGGNVGFGGELMNGNRA